MAIRDEESHDSEVFIPLFKLSNYLSEISFDEEKIIPKTVFLNEKQIFICGKQS